MLLLVGNPTVFASPVGVTGPQLAGRLVWRPFSPGSTAAFDRGQAGPVFSDTDGMQGASVVAKLSWAQILGSDLRDRQVPLPQCRCATGGRGGTAADSCFRASALTRRPLLPPQGLLPAADAYGTAIERLVMSNTA